MGLQLELTSSGGPAVPALNEKLTISRLQIIKFWAEGAGTRMYLTGLSSQEEDILINESVLSLVSRLGGTQSAFLLRATGRGTLGGPGNDIRLYISSLKIIKFWADGAGTKVFVEGLSTQQEEVDIQEDYVHVQNRLGGAGDNS